MRSKSDRGRAQKEQVQLRECVLEKEGRLLFNWLPGRYAREGLWVMGEEDDGTRSPGWKVIQVCPIRPRQQHMRRARARFARELRGSL